jgi:rare lipoprotein A
MHDLTAAHRTIPFNSLVRVKNLATNQAVTVRINDRGPFKGDRIIDLSYEAAMRIGMIQNGTAPVELEIVELGPSQH